MDGRTGLLHHRLDGLARGEAHDVDAAGESLGIHAASGDVEGLRALGHDDRVALHAHASGFLVGSHAADACHFGLELDLVVPDGLRSGALAALEGVGLDLSVDDGLRVVGECQRSVVELLGGSVERIVD